MRVLVLLCVILLCPACVADHHGCDVRAIEMESQLSVCREAVSELTIQRDYCIAIGNGFANAYGQCMKEMEKYWEDI